MKIALFIKNRKSQIMIISLIIMVLVFTLGAGLLFNSRTARNISGLEVAIEKAKSQARSGVGLMEVFIAQAVCGPAPVNESYNLGDGNVDVAITVDLILKTGSMTSMGRSGNSTNVINKDFNIPITYGWNYRRKITIRKLEDHGITGDLGEFPVLVTITLDNVTQADGGDIIFVNSDVDTQFAHEIESFDSVTGALNAWVQVPALLELSETTIYVYYGNDDVALPDQWNIAGAWDANYNGVWHFNENFLDATLNNNDGVNNNTTDDIGKIAQARHFDGLEDYVILSGTSLVNYTYNEITMSAWYRSDDNDVGVPTEAQDDENIYHHHRNTGNWTISFGITSDSGQEDKLKFYYRISGQKRDYYGTSDVVDQQWHHLAVVRTSTRIKIYVDGVEELNTADIEAGASIAPSTGGPWIGNNPGKTGVHGKVDDFRLSNIARSAGWIKAEYVNQNNVLDFMSFDGEESCN